MNDFNDQREFEKQVEGGPINIPDEVGKLYTLRKLLSRAWMPMGISKDEAVDILLWAIGDDVKQLHFSHWPERIKERTGLSFDIRKTPVIAVLKAVGKEWLRRKPVVFPA